MPYNQDYVIFPVRSAAILTNSYVAGTVIGTDQQVELLNQFIVYVDLTIGSLTSASIKVEYSSDNSAWYQESFSSISAGVDTLSAGEHKMSATGTYRLALPIKDRYIRISAIGTGTVTSSSMGIKAIVGLA